ncbi:protein ALP1-like [Myzus persicae]|uniref:protein ALP1-like n=1 Tax=Myzus persicae TaxID=13164 RepID=UPI000B9363A8|nr:protein ALP1-like [Myzus persicae]
MPTTKEEWQLIANDFNCQWNFPFCIGSMDGKHIMLQAPVQTGSEYINYEGFFSIVLFAVVDANYNFIYVNVGCQGRISDGGVFANTTFKHFLENQKLNLPEDMCLPGREKCIPHTFVADDAFPLKKNIMKPYPGTQEKGSKKRIFNYRLSRTRRVVENSFGIVSATFRVLRKPMLLEPKKATIITLTCVHLHNFLRKSFSSRTSYTPPGIFDIEDLDGGTIIPGQWRRDQNNLTPLARIGRKPSLAAQEIRDEFCDDFFQSAAGKVPWQDNY